MVYFGFFSLGRMGLRKIRLEVEDTRLYRVQERGRDSRRENKRDGEMEEMFWS